MKRLGIAIYFVLIVLFSGNLFSQSSNNGVVTGSIKAKSTNQPIENVSVVLFSAGDSSMISGAMTDEKGVFSIEHVSEGTYYVIFSCVGYVTNHSGSFTIDPQNWRNNLGVILMTQTSLILKDIVVQGEKPTLSNSIDRKVYNIQKDIMAQSGSASELLQNIPSVSVDIDGNVSLRGSSNVLILVNGKTSPLMGKSRADVLQQMPANSIERIEVITNPSAKYKPDGTSGIINLVLKKNTNKGWGGSISANSGVDSRYNGNIGLNYNPGGFNIFTSYGLRKDNRNRRTEDSRQYYYPAADSNSYYYGDDHTFDRPLSHIAMLGIDYSIDEKTSLGISGNYFYKSFTRMGIAGNISRNKLSAISSDYYRNRFDPEYEREKEATAYIEHSFAKKDHKLRAEFNISDQPEQEDNHYTNIYMVPNQSPEYDNNRIKQGEKQTQISLEYTNPISEDINFESGYSREIIKQDFDIFAQAYDKYGKVFITDTVRTNRFLFDQNIDALYGTLEHSFGKFNLMAGARFEYVQNRANLVTTNTRFQKYYASFYPTLHMAYELNKNSELQLNYSRRTNRPEGEELNPFPEYRDPLNIRVGNPHLLPEYIHSVEFGWQLRNERFSVTPSIYYRYRYNKFTSVTEIVQDSILLTTEANLSHDQSTGLELVLNGSLGSHLDVDISTNLFNNTIDASNIGLSKGKSIVTWSGNFNLNLKMTPGTVLQVNSYYQSSRLTPQGRILPSFVLNLGVRHHLKSDKLSLIVTISDILKTRRQKIELRTLELNRDVNSTRDGRLFYTGLIYHFGASPKKNKEKSIEFDNNS